VSTFGGYAYDAMMLIVEAVTQAGEATPQAIRDNLEQISGFIATGGIFELSPEDHNGLDERAFVMVRIDGRRLGACGRIMDLASFCNSWRPA
jgi:branched-chain amino acid transport system substrate-binding protein